MTTAPETSNSRTALFSRRVRVSITASERNGEPLKYTSELSTRSTEYFRTLQTLFCNAMEYLFGTELAPTLRNIGCTVLSFENGSVIANIEMTLGADSATDADDLVNSALDLSSETTQVLDSGTNNITVSAIAVTVLQEGLPIGAIIGIIFGVVGALLIFIMCMCCVFMQMASRNNATKFMQGDRYNDHYDRGTPFFYSGDSWLGSHDSHSEDLSFDQREFAVGQAVGRLTRERELRGQRIHGNRAAHVREHDDDHFSTPYVVDGSDNISVERNPLHY